MELLIGGNYDHILIAGRATSDAILGNLQDLRIAWIAPMVPYATCITNLLSTGGGSNSSLKQMINALNNAGEVDRLTRGIGTDWDFRALNDVIADLFVGEVLYVA